MLHLSACDLNCSAKNGKENEVGARFALEMDGLVEQHLHFVRQADRYYAMQRGGIVASGSTSDLSQSVVDQFLSV